MLIPAHRLSINHMHTYYKNNIFRKAVLTIIMTIPFFATSNAFADTALYLLTAERGVLESTNKGKSWNSFNKGLPKIVYPLRIYSNGTYLFLATFNSGLFRCLIEGREWEPVNSPLFKARSIYYPDTSYRKVSAFASDPKNSDNLVMATKHSLYHSLDSGKTWEECILKGFDRRNYITALAVQGDTIIAGTSFNGIYFYSGGRWQRRTQGHPAIPYSHELSFFEQVIALANDGDTVYAGLDFGGGVLSLTTREHAWKKITVSEEQEPYSRVHDIQFTERSLFIAKGNDLYKKESKTDLWNRTPLAVYCAIMPENCTPIGLFIQNTENLHPPLFFTLYGKKNIPGTSTKRALYASIPALTRNSTGLINAIKKCRFNAIVIDMKDDYGNLFYPTALKTAFEIGAVRKSVPVQKLIERLHSEAIYAIARIVVFKDEKLFKAYNNNYCIQNSATGRPWQGNTKEYWVDPHSRFVHQYTIDIAKELETIGFDEIQFDYIRFPSDGPTSLCHYTFREDRETYKSEILSDFLMKAKSALRVPISVDIYGFNSWYYFGNWIGQDMEAFSHIVDVICPMVYPSHFGPRFYSHIAHSERPFRIIYDGGIRAHAIASSATEIRPYLQAFDLLSPSFGPGYIKLQVDGAEQSTLHGYTFWNAKGDYRVVVEALSD